MSMNEYICGAGVVVAGLIYAAGVTLRSFPGVLHSFINPGADEIGDRFDMQRAYDEDASARAWAETPAFYRELFGH